VFCLFACYLLPSQVEAYVAIHCFIFVSITQDFSLTVKRMIRTTTKIKGSSKTRCSYPFQHRSANDSNTASTIQRYMNKQLTDRFSKRDPTTFSYCTVHLIYPFMCKYNKLGFTAFLFQFLLRLGPHKLAAGHVVIHYSQTLVNHINHRVNYFIN
jgi:hypothetical protein